MVNCINLIIEMSQRFVLGWENVPCIAEVVNRSLKADCTDFTSMFITSFPASCFNVTHTGKTNFDVISRLFILDLGHSSLVVPIKIQIFSRELISLFMNTICIGFLTGLLLKRFPEQISVQWELKTSQETRANDRF